MATLVGSAIALLLCLAYGQFSAALITAGMFAFIGIRYHIVGKIAFVLFASTFALVAMVSSDSEWAVFLPLIVVWFAKEIAGEPLRNHSIWIIFLPLALFGFSFQDRDLRTIILIGFVLTLPNITALRVNYVVTKLYKQFVLAVFLLLLGLFTIILFYPRFSGRVALIDAGAWAKATTQLNDTNNLTIESMYSYSEFKQLLNAETITPMDLNDTYSEAWMITPTTPLNASATELLWKWVKQGGRLIVVTDHTDLFGHGRVVNSFVSSRSLATSLSAFFPMNPNSKAEANLGKNAWLKTSNVQSGLFMWPQYTARWISESADYSNRNFFGPLSLSEDDKIGRRTISGAKAIGKGRVVLFGDSTSFANFAIYQPRIVPLIEKIRTGSIFSCLVPIIWGALVLSIIILLAHKKHHLIFVIPVIGLLAISDIQKIPVMWEVYDWWAGDEKNVIELGNPKIRLSTAYAVSVLSGHKPRWTEKLQNRNGGFWVGPSSPPNTNWRWIDIADTNLITENYDTRFDPLITKVSKNVPSFWPKDPDANHICIGGVWTDDTLGDWWFDRGISLAKRTRIEAWIAWLIRKPLPPYPRPIHSDGEMKQYQLRIEGQNWETLTLSELPFEENTEYYLGRGVSVTSVRFDDQAALLGTKPFTESWDCAYAWIIKPITGTHEPNE